MPTPPGRLKLMYMRWQLAQARQQHDAVLVALLLEQHQAHREQRRRRRWWVRPWLQRRMLHGQYDTLMQELMRESDGDFKRFLRVEPNMFHEMLVRVAPRITKCDANRPPLEPGLKLGITLRFLATGNSYRSLAFSFRVAHNTISLFVPEVCAAICAEYEDEVFKMPTTAEEWQPVADRFSTRWNFHHACGALDGKHIAIRKPAKSGSLYFNYKGFFSIVLLALVDADYKFMWAQVGANGSSSDCGIYNHSSLEQCLREGTIGFPDPEPLPHDDTDIPYFIIGDDAFPLRPYLVKPYAQRFQTHAERIFSYRCSRARRVVENAFGILANRFRCLTTTLATTPDNSRGIVKACLCLHNVMRMRYPNLQNAVIDTEGTDGEIIPGAWRDGDVLQDMEEANRAPRETRAGKKLRVYLKHYYNSEVGSVPWQEAAVNM